MFCIGCKLIIVLSGVDIILDNIVIMVKGLKGILICEFYKDMKVIVENNEIIVVCFFDNKIYCFLYGIMCSVVNNMVSGVIEGFVKFLELVGVGYCVSKFGDKIVLNVGYFYLVEIILEVGIEFEVFLNIKIIVCGIDKECVGVYVVKICFVCEFELYKGKGIKYEGECIICKEGKVGKKK